MSVLNDTIASRNAARQGHACVVFLFFVCFAFSYLDRQIVSILVQPIKQTLALTDTQIGLLQGFSFTLCYATAGVVVARLIDRSNRVRIIAVCIAVWAVSTALCGVAQSFPQLLLARAGTAVAEAGLSPAALSIFSDLYPPRKVTRASSIFMLGPYVGGGAALFGGGMLLAALGGDSAAAWVAGSGLAAWQWVFVIVGLPGVGLAALVAFTVREPARHNSNSSTESADAQAPEDPPVMRIVLHELFVRHRFCLPYFGAYVALITLFYSHSAWFPTLLIRRFHLIPQEVGQLAAPAYMLGGVFGVLTAGMLGSKTNDESALCRVLGLSAIAAAVLVPAAVAMPLADNIYVAVILYGVCAFAASAVMALAPVPIQVAIPNRMRGRAIALLVFLTNLISGGFGPFAVGYLNERLQMQNGLAIALAGVGSIAAFLSALLYLVATLRVRPAGQNQNGMPSIAQAASAGLRDRAKA